MSLVVKRVKHAHLPAHVRQSPHDPLLLVAKATQPHLAAAFRRAFAELKTRLDDRFVHRAMTSGNLLNALAPALDAFKTALQGTKVFLANSHLQGHTITKDQINGTVRKAVVQFDLDTLPQSTQDALDGYDFDLIQQVTDDVRDSISATIQRGISNGWAPAKMARQIRGSIGLTDSQSQAVDNYRNLLENGSPDALTRQLRDFRFDGTVQDAVDGLRTLAPDQVDAMVGRYEDRYVAFRADTIARSEALRAANGGAYDAIQQAIDDGTLDPDSVYAVWQISDDELTCDKCRSIVDEQPDGVPYGTPFRWNTVPKTKRGRGQSGEVMYPGLHPLCRCTIAFRIEGTGADDQEGQSYDEYAV